MQSLSLDVELWAGNCRGIAANSTAVCRLELRPAVLGGKPPRRPRKAGWRKEGHRRWWWVSNRKCGGIVANDLSFDAAVAFLGRVMSPTLANVSFEKSEAGRACERGKRRTRLLTKSETLLRCVPTNTASAVIQGGSDPVVGFPDAPRPATQSLYFFSNLGSRRRREKPAVDYHFPSVAFSPQEGLVSRSPIRVVAPQTTTFDHSSMGVTESMTRIAMSSRAIAGDRDAIPRSNGEIAAFVHRITPLFVMVISHL
jgi:hypothetical protein